MAIGNALAVVCTREHVPRLLILAADSRYRRARQMFIYKLGDFGDPSVFPTLVALLDDDDVSGHATFALGRLGRSEGAAALRPELIVQLERMATSSAPLARRMAKKALSRLAG